MAHAVSADLAQNAVLAANATNAVDAVNVVNGVPKGVIVMWSGLADHMPAGWALCDGTNQPHENRPPFISLGYIMKL